MPRFVSYLLIAAGAIVSLRLLVESSAYDVIGYVEDTSHTKQKSKEIIKSSSNHEIDLNKIDSLIDKRISERDTITLEVVSAGFLKNRSGIATSPKSYLKVKGEEVNTIERSISIKNLDADDDHEYFKHLKEEYLDKINKELPPGKLRTDMVVRYYKHYPDGKGVYELKELKYYIHERDAKNERIAKMPSNALFYGDNIRDEDIKIVAYTLMENGIPIKTIEPSQFSKDWKSNVIEIGADSSLLESKALTLGEVRAFIH